VLADFVALGGWNTLLGGVTVPLPGTGVAVPPPGTTASELIELDQLVYYRPSVHAEAMAQNRGILQYFSGILDFNLRSRPATVYLCTAALRIASFQAMYYKFQYDRARPSRLSPRLMPPIDPPGHAAFPSGHATQARLIALCLEVVMPAAIIPVDALNAPQPEEGPLRKMAARIARNREVLGLHYPSDSLHGKGLADETFDMMKVPGNPGPPAVPPVPLGKVKTLTNVITVAKVEWA